MNNRILGAVLSGAMTLFAPSLIAAQTYFGTNAAAGYAEVASFRNRNFPSTAGGSLGGRELYIGTGLGGNANRDEYGGVWSGNGSFDFTLAWISSSNTFNYTVSNFAVSSDVANSAPPNTSYNSSTNAFSYVLGSGTSFNYFTLTGKTGASITSLVYVPGGVDMLASKGNGSVAGDEYWTVSSGSDFTIRGTFTNTPTQFCNSGEACSFQLGVGTVVPEPSTYALMGAGLLGLFAVQRRRRRV